MKVERLRLRDFRTYAAVDVRIGPGITVVYGANGAGKTNLVEGLYFGCTGRSCRTSNEREIVRFGAEAARAEVGLEGGHELAVGFQPGQPKHFRVDGAPAERLEDSPQRPLVSVFLPDRLELVKGAPGLRRAHIDQVVGGSVADARRNPPGVCAGARAAQRPAVADPCWPRRSLGACRLGR